MTKKIPYEIQSDLKTYKQEDHFLCRNCKKYEAKFTYLKFEADKIFWLFNCSNCGEDWKQVMKYDLLRDLYYYNQHTKNRDDDDYNASWRCFRLGLWYDEVFQFAHDKDAYNQIIVRLNKDASGLKKFWYGRMHHVKANIRQKFARS